MQKLINILIELIKKFLKEEETQTEKPQVFFKEISANRYLLDFEGKSKKFLKFEVEKLGEKEARYTIYKIDGTIETVVVVDPSENCVPINLVELVAEMKGFEVMKSRFFNAFIIWYW